MKLLMLHHLLQKSAKVYRGMGIDVIGMLGKGSEFTDDGFVSTSTTQSTAERFAWNRGEGVVMEITLPKGTQGLYINALTDHDYDEETEFLLGTGNRFKVNEVKMIEKGKYTVKAELLQE